MNIYQFMSDSPFLSFFIAYFTYEMLVYIFYRLPNRYLRSRNIKNQGWPPSHCDADGDAVEEDSKSHD